MDHPELDILIEKVKSGDSSSFEPIVNQYKNMVYSVCLKITENPELAEDTAQETFVKAFRKLNTFKKHSKFSTWLYKIAYRTSLNAISKNKLHQKDISVAASVESEDNSIDDLTANERKHFINLALDKLGTNEKTLMTLFYLEELNTKEVAEITGLSLANVKVKVHRTRKKLYTILSGILKDELNSIRE